MEALERPKFDSGDRSGAVDAASSGDTPAAADAPPPPPALDALPRTVLSAILEAAIEASNPASVVALAMTCRSLLAACRAADGLWGRQCARLGWPAAPGAFCLFSSRMRARKLLRARLARVLEFLPRRAAAAFQRGAAPAELRAAEARLGVSLPAELWELLRHRDGQAPGPGVAIADDARLLSARELYVEERELPPIRLAPQTPAQPLDARCAKAAGPHDDGGWEARPRGVATGASSSGGGEGCSGGQQHRPAAEDASTAPAGEALLPQARARIVVFASNSGGSRAFGCVAGSGDGGGAVYVLRGMLTTRRVADSVTAWLARLLT
ncbi:hypothetical protein Rsub_05733 [Raphidocelis subcapitata]|uniref:Knr4/Smi1-like domain-containing protein n=1 Tax=Raphidocelis subcapitata TaxID=307507 RepID=A0A2V0P6T2_9CHLO|nr:hypothetical protein Rsub_05733 [Raphidocelis subcapitata]|eukprot:GBF92897.1 hypothetical protein Rsub_05733 [Raphidocelis subcapitata]